MEMTFKDSEEEDSITFKTHEQLDQFVWDKINYIESMGGNYKKSSAWQLLKGFDRAFWLQNQSPCKDGCPFEDPKMNKTNSLKEFKKMAEESIFMLESTIKDANGKEDSDEVKNSNLYCLKY